MARQGQIETVKKIQRLVSKFSEQRNQLKQVTKNKDKPMSERIKAMFALDRLPKRTSKVRLRNTCAITGSSRSYYRVFGLCRHELKKQATLGRIPGVRRASW